MRSILQMRNQTHLQIHTVSVALAFCTNSHTNFDFLNTQHAPGTHMKMISDGCPGLCRAEDKLKHLGHETLWLLAKDVTRESQGVEGTSKVP